MRSREGGDIISPSRLVLLDRYDCVAQQFTWWRTVYSWQFIYRSFVVISELCADRNADSSGGFKHAFPSALCGYGSGCGGTSLQSSLRSGGCEEGGGWDVQYTELIWLSEGYEEG